MRAGDFGLASLDGTMREMNLLLNGATDVDTSAKAVAAMLDAEASFCMN